MEAPELYGADLARIHHEHFGQTAEAAAGELLRRLRARDVSSGTIVDLACGTGILARHLVDASFDVLGVDASPHMLDLAGSHAPEARLRLGSLWDIALPDCVAVTAVGEAFNYATDAFTPGLDALERRLGEIARVLVPGGLLVFDVAGPGRAGPSGRRRRSWHHQGMGLVLEEDETRGQSQLTRTIATTVPAASGPGRSREEHRLVLYAPEDVAAILDRTGFTSELLEGYAGHTEALEGWHHFAAIRRSE